MIKPVLHNIIKPVIGSMTSNSSSRAWNPRSLPSKFLEGWKITGAGNLVGLILGNTLVVGGSAGSYTFQVPNTTPYQNADADYIWFKTDVSQRTATEAEMVGYDLAKTFVKYDNTTPYAIKEIWILKAGQTLTTAEENHMRDYCQLSIWWSNVSSDHGMTKGNRSGRQSFWPSSDLPTVTTTAITSIADISSTGGGNVTAEGGRPVIARGVCWGIGVNPTIANSKTSDSTGSGAFTSSLTGLTGNTLYHVRAYATSIIGTSYGSDVTFTSMDSSVEALITRMIALTETPADARRVILNTAILADKAASLWAGYDAFWLLAAHGPNSALLNILADAFNCTLVSTPAFATDRGYTGAANKALKTWYNPTANHINVSANDFAIGIYIRTNNNTGSHVFSAYDGTSQIMLAPREGDGNAYVALNSAYGTFANADSSGMWILTRSASTGFTVYKNGAGGAQVKASTGLLNIILHLLCNQNNGTLANFTNREASLAFVRKSMSPTDVANFQTIWVDGYLNAIGAKV